VIKFEKISLNQYNKDLGEDRESEYNSIRLPTKNDVGSAGCDIYANYDVTLNPKEMVIVKTGLKVSLDNCNQVVKLYTRSSVGIKQHLMLANTVGIIDASYYNNKDNEGHLMVALYNYGEQERTIKAGEKYAQAVIVPVYTDTNCEILNATRDGGIGSSGK
jgi:dUTP pyrophosphatase